MGLKCCNCGEVSDKLCTFTKQEELELTTGRGTANLIIKCKFCSRENSVEVIDSPLGKFNQDDREFAAVASFDCRGVELDTFEPADGWVGTTENGKEFEINLAEDFCDFDED